VRTENWIYRWVDKVNWPRKEIQKLTSVSNESPSSDRISEWGVLCDLYIEQRGYAVGENMGTTTVSNNRYLTGIDKR